MLSSLLEDVIKSYDEIKETYHKAKAMLKSVETLSDVSKTMLDESITTHQHIKSHLDEFEKVNFDEKIARFEIAFSKLPSLKQSFDKSEEDIKALLKQIVSKNAEFESTKTKLEQINTNFNATKDEAKTIIDNFYAQSAEVLNTINKALELYLASAEEIRLSEDTIRSHKKHIDQKVLECKTIKDEIVSMRERSQCLMNKAEELLTKADGFWITLNENIAKIQELENGYNQGMLKNQELETKITNSINTLNEILVIIGGASFEEVLLALKDTNVVLANINQAKTEIDTIKTNLEQTLTEQNAKLGNYYTKLENDNIFDLTNDEVVKLQTNKADKTELEPIKADITSLATNKANASDVYTKTEVDTSQKAQDELINAKANDEEVVKLAGEQNIKGIKIFNDLVKCSVVATTGWSLINKNYIDDVVAKQNNKDTQQDEKIKTLETNKADKTTTYTKTEVDASQNAQDTTISTNHTSVLNQLALQNTQMSKLMTQCQNLLTKIELGGGKVGMVFMYAGATIPSNYMLCDGRELSKAEYPQLFQAIGTIYGESADKLKFKIPDLRGKFVRCVGGNASALGVKQGDAIRNITGYFGAKTLRGIDYTSGVFKDVGVLDKDDGWSGFSENSVKNISFDASRVVPTANENRPINMSMNFIIQVKE